MIVPVVLSGGSGTRLWPLSRERYPKQFLALSSEKSLFQETILRLPDELKEPLIICNEVHRFLAAEQLREIQSNNSGIILEPHSKNTAPAIALAAFQLLKKNQDPIMLVVSADHIISDNDEFKKSIQIAQEVAKKGKIVAFGVSPKSPEIGYGYIETSNSKSSEPMKIISFTEKPDIVMAQHYLDSGNFLWNTGIFMLKASVFLKELQKFENEIYSSCMKSIANIDNDLDFIRINNSEFKKCPSKSIDYAVMERTKDALVVPFNGKWNDLGSWDSLWTESPKDKFNNVIEGDTITYDVTNSYIYGSNRLISIVGLSDLIVIDSEDALLILSKKNPQDVKKIVRELKKKNRPELLHHQKVHRPWGLYFLIDQGQNFQVKRIIVNPGAKLSLQKHTHRSEHWIVVKGFALITRGKEEFNLNKNESTYIPKGTIHRLENIGEKHLEIIEIQTGDYLGEDDIIRLEDLYKRQ